jgi:hypothetical protein
METCEREGRMAADPSPRQRGKRERGRDESTRRSERVLLQYFDDLMLFCFYNEQAFIYRCGDLVNLGGGRTNHVKSMMVSFGVHTEDVSQEKGVDKEQVQSNR